MKGHTGFCGSDLYLLSMQVASWPVTLSPSQTFLAFFGSDAPICPLIFLPSLLPLATSLCIVPPAVSHDAHLCFYSYSTRWPLVGLSLVSLVSISRLFQMLCWGPCRAYDQSIFSFIFSKDNVIYELIINSNELSTFHFFLEVAYVTNITLTS